MRGILFRGQTKSDKKWIYGNLLQTDNGTYVIQNYAPFEGIGKYEVDPETICQYTELTDKNGRKIFENDIVKINDNVKESFEISDGVVIYHTGSFIIDGSNGNGTLNSLFVIAGINYVLRGEVIGNIFDNPELIGE